MFACKRCGHSTNIKGDFKKHLNRKTQCKPELSELDVLILHPDFFSNEKNKEHICEYCLKGFSARASKSFHKKTCPEKIQQTEKIQELEEQKKELEKKLEESEKKSGKGKTIKTINNNNNNSNNTTINNNIIKLNVFGKENLDFLVNEPTFKKFMIRCLTNTDNGYIQLMDKIYFNEAHPENQNIKKTNSKDDFIKCFNGSTWDVMYSDSALEIIMDRISSAFYIFFDWIDENEEEKVKSDILKTFMKEVGHPLNLDFSGYNYDFLYDKNDDTQIRKKKKILQKFCVLNIYNKSAKVVG